jgi:hypothetical protein
MGKDLHSRWDDQSVAGFTQVDLAAKQSSTVRAKALHILNAPAFMPVCFAIYMAVRIASLFVSPLEQTSDFQWYYQRAVEIVSGSGYAENGVLTAFWPVGWPGFLATLFTITGPAVLAGQIANLAFAAAVFWLIAVFGTAAFGTPLVGRIAVLILTLYPNQIGYVPLLSTEIFYQAILLSGVVLLMRESLVSSLLAGLFFGIATLTKTQSLFMPGCILVCICLIMPSKAVIWRFLRIGTAVYMTIIVVVAPWTYRNYTALHAFIPVSTNGGWTLLTGNNPEASGDYTPNTTLAEGITHNPAEQVAMDRLAHARAVNWIERNPADFLRLMPKKIWRLWVPDGESEWFYQRGFAHYDRNVLLFRSLRILNQAYYLGIMLVAFSSVWLIRRNRTIVFAKVSPWAIAGLSLCIYTSIISIAFSGQSRFHFSLMPFVVLYAAWTLALVWGDNQTSRSSPETFR